MRVLMLLLLAALAGVAGGAWGTRPAAAAWGGVPHVVHGEAEVRHYATDDASTWPVDPLEWDAAPVDLSFLNARERPAGKRGFVAARGDVLVFEDGTPARFWGTNLTARALFGTERENVRAHARRLSRLGFNLVRLHHHDSRWVDPNVFGGGDAPDTRTLSATMLERIDWWISCLKDEGLYIWLDLHVGRHFKPGDGVDGFDEMSKGKPNADLKGFNYVNPAIKAAMKRFNEAYLGHRNAYTGVAYKDEPAIVAVLITNENDITHHFGNAMLPDRNVPHHGALFLREAAAFAAAHNLPADKVWRSPGPAKIFLNDLERRFHADMVSHLRTLGVRVPIATTSTWGSAPLSSLPALTEGSIVDAHAYGTNGELERNPFDAPNMMHWLAAARVAGMPVSVSEWNVEPFPVPDRHAVPLYMAASGRLQGWDAVIQYAYAVAPLNDPAYPSNWHAFNDPALLATLPAAALLYRRGDVGEATTVFAFAPTPEQLFGQKISPRNARALRTAAEKGKLMVVMPPTPELPWLRSGTPPAGAQVVTDPAHSFIAVDAASATSGNGELRRSWRDGTFAIDTPRTQAAMGRIGGRRISLADVEIAAATPSATVCVQSLDAKPIAQSDSLLLSLGGRAMPRAARQLPFHAEPVAGYLTIRARSGLRLHVAGRAAGTPLAVPYRDGRYRITLDQVAGAHWLLLGK